MEAKAGILGSTAPLGTVISNKRMPTLMNGSNKRIISWVMVCWMAIFTMPFLRCMGYTDAGDVYAINNLHVALGSPPLPGWIPNGGDPCTESWQGVQCVGSNITAIVLSGANLGGQLGGNLQNFTSIITINLSNNHIGGSIPENLPPTMMEFFLSANQFTGSIPSSLSELTLLSAMSVNNNLLTGELPDCFQSLTGLVNLDLSSNNLNGQLPPSMESLSSLTALHVENNQLSGTLDVLQDLPLKDLNIENNLFSGPVPENLLSIPNLKKDGNPFNTTTAPSTMPLSPPSPLSAPAPESTFVGSSDGSSIQDSSHPGKKKTSSVARAVGYALVAVSLLLILVLMTMFFISKYKEGKQRGEEILKWQKTRENRKQKEPKGSGNLVKPNNKIDSEEGKTPETLKEPKNNTNLIKLNSEIEKAQKDVFEEQKKENEICTTEADILAMPPLVRKVTVNPIISTEKIPRAPPQRINLPATVKSFSVASLQQYTNSFGEENLVRNGRFGNIYLAELPQGEVLAVMKLDNVYSNVPIDEFLELVLSISELRHPNILELVGYCAEFGQRLLVYNHFSTRSLHDVLHFSDDLKCKLPWNARIRIALGTAKALEYLHEGCQPAVVHQNIEPSNVLLDDELAICVSECGLASLMTFHSVTQLSGRLHSLLSYEAPEINESGSNTCLSDIYSFGVVMLELLTGRKPYDSSRPRAEQHLVRWASSQIYDINALSKMVDPCINGRYPIKSLSRFADIISRCIQIEPGFRPPMSEVVQDLTRMIEEARKGADHHLHLDQDNKTHDTSAV